MGEVKQRGVVVRAGSSGGQVLVSAVAACVLWYTFDDRLAGLTGIGELATLPVTLAFAGVLFVAVLLSVAGMQWDAD